MFQTQISRILAELESKQGPMYDLWQVSKAACMADFDKTYRWMDVHFDHIFYESEVSEESQLIVDEYIQKGLFVESHGAIGVDMSAYKLGFFMARKSDGTSLYITKDLALARKKFKAFHIDRSIYVVGNEQILHFQQLFKALEMMAFPQAKKCFHLSYAHVKLPEGKMSSRKGNTVTFAHLVQMVLQELEGVLKKYDQLWTPQDITDTAQTLAKAAIKYGMTVMDPHKEITFDPIAWTSFEGNSGPYLLYSYARSLSILEKAHAKGVSSSTAPSWHQLQEHSETDLIKCMYEFHRAVHHACEQYKPSTLAVYLYELCKTFNRFYAHINILATQDAPLQRARLGLVEAFGKVLKTGLSLLGIATVSRM